MQENGSPKIDGEVSELVECAALEMRCTLLMCTVGSNPTLSASPLRT